MEIFRAVCQVEEGTKVERNGVSGRTRKALSSGATDLRLDRLDPPPKSCRDYVEIIMGRVKFYLYPKDPL